MLKSFLLSNKGLIMFKKSIKYFTIMVFLYSFSYAGLIDGIALTVNNTPITLLEINNYTHKFHIPTKDAMRILIQEKLEQSLIKKYAITTDNFEINNQMQRISKDAGMSLKDFEHFIVKTGMSLKQYKKNLARKIEKRKLYRQITSKRIKRANEKELKNYYKKHISLYSIPKMFEVIKYISPRKSELVALVKNPMINLKNISQKDRILKTKEINPKLLSIFLQTKNGEFTPILNFGKGYMIFYIKRKINVTVIPFKKVRERIFATIMDNREKNILKTYFDKLISKAQIKIIREPN